MRLLLGIIVTYTSIFQSMHLRHQFLYVQLHMFFFPNRWEFRLRFTYVSTSSSAKTHTVVHFSSQVDYLLLQYGFSLQVFSFNPLVTSLTNFRYYRNKKELFKKKQQTAHYLQQL